MKNFMIHRGPALHLALLLIAILPFTSISLFAQSTSNPMTGVEPACGLTEVIQDFQNKFPEKHAKRMLEFK